MFKFSPLDFFFFLQSHFDGIEKMEYKHPKKKYITFPYYVWNHTFKNY